MKRKSDTVASIDFKHPSSCDFVDPGHRIRRSYIDVLEETADYLSENVEIASTGCGGCFNSNADVTLFWVAQNNAVDYVHIKYDTAGEITKADVLEALEVGARRENVPHSIPPSTDFAVVLGVSDYYRNLEPGTIVEKDGTEGTILSPEWFAAHDTPWSVFIGEKDTPKARFADKEAAENYADFNDNASVFHNRSYGDIPGENYVIWHGYKGRHIVRTSDLDAY